MTICIVSRRETVAGAATQNGSISYTYDAVGNRTQRNSTLPALPATGLLNYDANDRTATDPYDANGNLLLGGPGANVYGFENRLVQAGSIQIVYDGDGNRVQETVAGATTSYLVADQNLTGYAQVVEELRNGAVNRAYSYGLELINQRQTISGASTTSFYGFDGHGSVRFLTSSTGAITDTYDYDAFGNLISSTGSTPNSYLFAGEQFDSALGIYYNRTRYYDQRPGRFWSMDTWEGVSSDPLSLHKYLYVGMDPVNHRDPSGRDFVDTIGALAVQAQLYVMSVPGLLASAFAAGGTAVGVFFNELGAVAERYGGVVLEEAAEELPEIKVFAQEEIPNSTRVIDFVVRAGQSGAQAARQMFIEAKYGIPYRVGPAMTRLVAQMQAAVQASQDTGVKVVLWTLRAPNPAQMRLLLSQLGDLAENVQVVSGVEALYTVVSEYFKGTY